MIEAIGFYFFATLCIVFFSISIFSKKTLYAMSSLAAGMIFVSGLFFILNAEFLGVVQIIVYTGAVVVLYAFSMMFFDANLEVKEKVKAKKLIYTLCVFSSLLLFLMILMPFANFSFKSEILNEIPNTNAIGKVLFSRYILVFEIAALMLLVAMICGIVLTHKEMDKKELK
ncbi:NADH-quinone oxidoreductase subunit J [Campylobacter sp. FMV-PI01]|uniref:NADH-quinone oxidoreductase subunit J n=1 Tax=Campylobacter portucalensis TaxID=2608384 RepID=A0A6L5WFI8_9BACT|nr:NADH-quinone oxidoreductase subunit J [Campylobacter portucalensis]MSN95714.1 NADH-quinone oxidoreductase subunit J [Campylobacter portucalensis]